MVLDRLFHFQLGGVIQKIRIYIIFDILFALLKKKTYLFKMKNKFS